MKVIVSMAAYLTIHSDGNVSHFNLEPDSRIIIGRMENCTLRFKDSRVSARHCCVEAYGDYFYIVDLDSTNGTYVNGSKIRSRKLFNGDVVQIGSVRLSFHWFDSEDSDEDITEADEYPDAESDTITIPEALPAEASTSPIKRLLGNYRIIRKIGQGGIGEVYKAESILTNAIVAIKILTPKAMGSQTIVERFVREAQALISLDHPRIIKVFEFNQEEERPYFAMEYIKGDPLNKFISKHGAISYRKALKIAGHIAHALAYAHRRNIIHRDLKPANIIIEEGDLHVKMIDLGLAKMFQHSDLTMAGQVVGTPRYMAPEQMVNSREVDVRADIYSLGATLYHMLAGIPPYSEVVTSKRSDLLRYIYHKPPIAIQKLVDIPDVVSAIVERAMSKDKEKRFKDANEIFRVLYNTVYKIKKS